MGKHNSLLETIDKLMIDVGFLFWIVLTADT